jgi:hypothetical protein
VRFLLELLCNEAVGAEVLDGSSVRRVKLSYYQTGGKKGTCLHAQFSSLLTTSDCFSYEEASVHEYPDSDKNVTTLLGNVENFFSLFKELWGCR